MSQGVSGIQRRSVDDVVYKELVRAVEDPGIFETSRVTTGFGAAGNKLLEMRLLLFVVILQFVNVVQCSRGLKQ